MKSFKYFANEAAKKDIEETVTEKTGTSELMTKMKGYWEQLEDKDSAAKGIVNMLNNMTDEEIKEYKIDIKKELNIFGTIAEMISSSKLGRL